MSVTLARTGEVLLGDIFSTIKDRQLRLDLPEFAASFVLLKE